jgi:hypothetical protein
VSDPEKRLITSALATLFFGYAAVNCLVLYRRMRRRAQRYTNLPFEGFVHSPQYNWTMWITGAIGAIGFLISSWQLVLSLAVILRGS